MVCHKGYYKGRGRVKVGNKTQRRKSSPQLWSVTKDTIRVGGGSKWEIRSKKGKAVLNYGLSQGIL